MHGTDHDHLPADAITDRVADDAPDPNADRGADHPAHQDPDHDPDHGEAPWAIGCLVQPWRTSLGGRSSSACEDEGLD
jgi:hypothetical protein